MEKILNGYFYNPTKGNLKVDQVIDEILSYIAEKPELVRIAPFRKNWK